MLCLTWCKHNSAMLWEIKLNLILVKFRNAQRKREIQGILEANFGCIEIKFVLDFSPLPLNTNEEVEKSR